MKPKQANYIRLKASDVRRCLRDLEILVVSYDRLGSAFHDDPDKLAIEADAFLSEVDGVRTLARMRGILSEAYESQRGRTEMMRLERRLEKMKVWGEPGFHKAN
jgi:hypothetical protein